MSPLFSISGSCVLRFLFSPFSYHFVLCFSFAWGLGRTFTIPFSTYCFPWEDLHFRSSSSLYSYCGRCATSACTAHSSVHYLRSIITTSYPCVFLFAISVLLCFLFFSSPARSLSALAIRLFQLARDFFCQWLCVRELDARCRLFQTVIPLYILFCAFVSFFLSMHFQREPEMEFLLFTLRFCNYQLPSNLC